MTARAAERLALALFLYTLAVFALMQGFAIFSNGAGAQELHEFYAPPSAYTYSLTEAGGALRVVLLLDLFFMIGYGGALAMTAFANRGRNPVMAVAALVGIGGLVLLDLAENVTMVLSLDLAENGTVISAGRIIAQVEISSLKWLVAALAVVALTFTLPRDTMLEKLLIWAARVMLPLGTGLFVTGAFEARLLGALLILVGMAGGFALLALTIWLRQRRPGP
ncbi:MAG TPA: hypothetical protein ENJ52_10525 [Aliiroseovarius sp.]|nr:hypothetical protein [Aliiroseovarius sp.]